MFGIIVVTHGKMGAGIIDAAEMIYAQPKDQHKPPIEIVSLEEGESPETLLDRLGDKIEKMKIRGVKGVLILTDLYGSSTTNAGTRMMLASLENKRATGIAVVSGLNLPMLLELIPALDKASSIEQLAKLAVEVGRKSIINITDEIEARRKK